MGPKWQVSLAEKATEETFFSPPASNDSLQSTVYWTRSQGDVVCDVMEDGDRRNVSARWRRPTPLS